MEPQAGTGLRSELLLGSTSSWHLPDSQKLPLVDSTVSAFWPVHLDELRLSASVPRICKTGTAVDVLHGGQSSCWKITSISC